MSKPSWEGLNEEEKYWRDHYDWFLAQGYRLRDRYQPDWVPSGDVFDGESWNDRVSEKMNDAIRVSDDLHVVLKRIFRSQYPEEVKILSYFAKEPLVSDKRNHCVPMLDVLQCPRDEGYDIAIIPILRLYDDPPFDTVGEAVDYIRQILQGFAFLHEHRVAHRDIKGDNILLDARDLQFPRFHFSLPARHFDGASKVKAKYTRTEKWPKYMIIDFGFAIQFTEDQMPPSIPPRPASDPTLPEFKNLETPCSPFPSDVYYVGNMLRKEFIDGDPQNTLREGYEGFGFLTPLLDAMTKEKPEDRLTMEAAVTEFDKIIAGLSVSKLRSQAIAKALVPAYLDGKIIHAAAYWARRIKYTVKRLPPVPPVQVEPSVDSAATVD